MKQPQWTRREMLTYTGTAGLAALGFLTARKATASSRYRERILKKHPVGYWRLGERSGSYLEDETRYKRDGLLYGTCKRDPSGIVSADPNGAIRLDGHGSYVEVADHADFSPSTSGEGLTVEAWMKPAALEFDTGTESEPYVHWLGKGEAGMQEWGFRFYSRKSRRPNRISAYVWNPEGGLGAGAYVEDVLRPHEWIHIVACYDPGDRNGLQAAVSIYKNGELRGGPLAQPPQLAARYKQYNVTPVHGKAPLRFGTRDKNSFFKGALDAIAIYPRVLSAAEIQENYREGI